MISVSCIVYSFFVQIDTSTVDEGEGWCAIKPVKAPPPPPYLLLTVPRRYFCCGFNLFYVRCCSILNVLILTLLYALFFNLVNVNELPPDLERAPNLAYHLLYGCLSIFPFDV